MSKIQFIDTEGNIVFELNDDDTKPRKVSEKQEIELDDEGEEEPDAE